MKNPIAACVDRNPFETVDELVEMAAAVGFDRIEWFEFGEKELWSNAELAPRIRALMRRHGLGTQFHSPYEAPFDLANDNGHIRTPRSVAAMLSTVMDRAERLDARMITVHLGSCPPGDDRTEALRAVYEGILLALPELERRAIRLALENHTNAIITSAIGDTPPEFDWLLDRLQSPWIGRTLDIGHAHINSHLEEFLARPFDRIFNMHLHDNHGKQDQHLALGEGGIDWGAVLERVARECYAGIVTFEFFTQPETYRRCIQKVRDA